jgi:heme-degrading monooxygenase HmoA
VIVSVLQRKTAIRDAEQWQQRADALFGRLRTLLERQDGFVDVELTRGDDGALAETTRWRSWDAYYGYLREGPAATAATIAEAFLPTAPYPNGNWTRSTHETPD